MLRIRHESERRIGNRLIAAATLRAYARSSSESVRADGDDPPRPLPRKDARLALSLPRSLKGCQRNSFGRAEKSSHATMSNASVSLAR
jgi:hypothetical protein